MTLIAIDRSSTISNSSGEKNGDGFEAAENDFVYETSCSTSSKKYEMGKNVDRHEVPITVQELSNGVKKQLEMELRAQESKVQVPTTVENLVEKESFQTMTSSNTTSSKQTLEKTVAKTEETFSSSFSSSSSSTLERTKSVSKPFNIVTSLPPLPRSHSQKMLGRESRSNSFSRESCVKTSESVTKTSSEMINKSTEAVNINKAGAELFEDGEMEPVEVKIKTLPRKVANFVGTLNKSEEIPLSPPSNKDKEDVSSGREEKETAIIVTAEPAIVIENADSYHGGNQKYFLSILTYELDSLKKCPGLIWMQSVSGDCSFACVMTDNSVATETLRLTD